MDSYTAIELRPYIFVSPVPVSIQDMNLDGVPEILIGRIEEEAVEIVRDYQILGWNGQRFENLLMSPQPAEHLSISAISSQDGWLSVMGYGQPGSVPWSERDIDNNGTRELVLTGGIAANLEANFNGPWRAETFTFMWNGQGFILHSYDFESPLYRFQAIQDGDRMSLMGEYQKALNLYQAAIFSDKLYAWSQENYQAQMNAEGQGTPTSTPISFDQEEYDNLTAYAHYRIMLLHLLQSDLGSAQVVYDTLQAKFPVGQAGHTYAEMAAAFWNNYQVTQNIGQACDQAITFATEYQAEILPYLGDRNHGWQSPVYEPNDICPFK